jgi:hypothetical protein
VQQQVCRNNLLLEPPLRPLQGSQNVVAHDPTQLLSVNCLFIKDDSTQVFTVKVPKSDNVSILKKMIKEEKARLLGHLDASDLILYKVSLSDAEVDSRLKEANAHSKWTSAVTRIHLKPLKKLNAVFPEPLQEDLVHIIFKHGPGTCPRYL